MKYLFFLSNMILAVVLTLYDITYKNWGFWVIILCASLNNMFGYLQED